MLVLSCFLAETNAIACDVCGCFIGVLPYDNQSAIGIMHRYRIFNGYPSAPAGNLFPPGAYRLSNPSALHAQHSNATPMLSPGDFESYKTIELRAKWFIHSRVELNLILPFSENRSGVNGAREKTAGMGDPTILAGFHLVRKTGEGRFRNRLVAGLGIKLPLGNCAAVSSSGERLPVMLQTGTGSTDGMLYMAYTGGGYNFRWGTTVAGKINGVNKYHEQFSPSITSTTFIGYLFSAGSWRFLPQCTMYSEAMNGLRENEVLVEGSSMKTILLGPGLNVFYKNLSLDCNIQFPVYEEKAAYNLLNTGKIMLALNWNFNQQHYLLKSKKS